MSIGLGMFWDFFFFFFFVLDKVWMATLLMVRARKQGKGEEGEGWRRRKSREKF